MPYAILRFKKCKQGGVTAAYAHNERKKETYKSNPDIAPERKQDNYHLILPKQTYLRETKRMIKAINFKTRSNSTVTVETLITASPEFMQALKPQEQREYFQLALSFVESKIGKDNIIAATVHMDETTPHMHLVFCPITQGKKGLTLSAKALLGGRTDLSKWQTEYHAAMSARFPELERGISASITGRKHIPQTLFKMGERLDKQFAEIAAALEGINHFNAPKKSEAALKAFQRVMPHAARFTAMVHSYDGYIKELERKEADTQKRLEAAESKGDERVQAVQGSMQRQLDGKDNELAEKDKAILAAQREAYEAADQLRRQANRFEGIIGRMPLDMRQKFYELQEKAAQQTKQKNQKDRGAR
jgi:hypothetical protein